VRARRWDQPRMSTGILFALTAALLAAAVLAVGYALSRS
jgi:hypothetical protein